ncbi:hypothetical protein RI054_34g130840 [Pseudoscourfieldia marina]
MCLAVVNAPATSQPNSAIPSNAQTHDELSRTPRPTTIRRHRAYTLRAPRKHTQSQAAEESLNDGGTAAERE